MFSKLDETLDEVYIPYYDRESHSIEHFKPDFIFWLRKADKYFIIFVDPKSTKFTAYEDKVEGYKRIFEDVPQRLKVFVFDGVKIRVLLSLYTEDPNSVAEGYRSYWYGGTKSIFDRAKSLIDLELS